MLPRRRLGPSGVEVSAAALGTLPFAPLCGGVGYGPITSERAEGALAAALRAGIDLVLTSDRFAPAGRLEGWLGAHLPIAAAMAAIDPATVKVATTAGASGDPKLPMRSTRADHLVESARASVARLGRSRLDLCLLDDPPLRHVITGNALDGLEAVRDAGLTRAIGVSVHAPQEAVAVAEQGRADVVCLPYSLLFPEAGLEAMKVIVDAGMTPLVREVLGNGFLGGRQQPQLPRPSTDVRARWSTTMIQGRSYAAEFLRGIGGPAGSLPQAAVRFVLDHPSLASSGVVALGVRTSAQLDELLAAWTQPPIPTDHLERLAAMMGRPFQGAIRVDVPP